MENSDCDIHLHWEKRDTAQPYDLKAVNLKKVRQEDKDAIPRLPLPLPHSLILRVLIWVLIGLEWKGEVAAWPSEQRIVNDTLWLNPISIVYPYPSFWGVPLPQITELQELAVEISTLDNPPRPSHVSSCQCWCLCKQTPLDIFNMLSSAVVISRVSRGHPFWLHCLIRYSCFYSASLHCY